MSVESRHTGRHRIGGDGALCNVGLRNGGSYTVALGLVAVCAVLLAVLTGCAGPTNPSVAAEPGGAVTGQDPSGGASIPAAAPSVPSADGSTVVASTPGSLPSAASTPPTATTFATGVAQPPAGVPSAVEVPDADGCDRSYGAVSQCIPQHAPGGGPVTCAVLAAAGYLPLLVTDDHLGLTSAPGARTDVVAGAQYLVGCPA